MKTIRLSLSMLLLSAVIIPAEARENVGTHRKDNPVHRTSATAASCKEATSSIDLNINNVRAKLLNGGDMWWDLNSAKYEVPKVDPGSGLPSVNSLFAGSIWVGGIDNQGQLKVAASTYRQNGNDYYPGPLDAFGNITEQTCTDFDKHWQVFGDEIAGVIAQYVPGGTIPQASIPDNVLKWPAKNNPFEPLASGRDLAPFQDVDGDGNYDPTYGDYPIIKPYSASVAGKPAFADQMIWWVVNDKGNIHTETGGEAIGLEMQTLAFAYKTNDEINDMTFYEYTLINKSSYELDSTFMGQWVDSDLGAYDDDYVGCDTTLSLGMDYNGDAVDGPTSPNYGNQPPIVGTDYFQGPRKYYTDTAGNEQSYLLRMSSFLYYNNDFSVIGNPELASHYYGYMAGTWKDGTPFTQGGNGHGGSVKSKYMFPSDPNDATGWSECSANNTAADRRYLQSSGPFTLKPGASNDIVIGVVWVRPPIGTYPCPGFDLIRKADQKAQALFDNGFQLFEGPEAPDMQVVELDRELILNLTGTNSTTVENYHSADPILVGQDIADSIYDFEGYMVFQLANDQVPVQEYSSYEEAINHGSDVRLVAQVDLKNNVTNIINTNYDATIGTDVPELMVQGADLGIKHSFKVTQDAFATGDKNLINHKVYYFTVISYAYNNFQVTDTVGVIVDSAGANHYITTYSEQKIKFISSRSTTVYAGIPHITSSEMGGLVINSDYGDGPEITRIEGKGNGGNWLEMTENSVSRLLSNVDGGWTLQHPTYKGGNGPVAIKVINPKKVPLANFELFLNDTTHPSSGTMNGTLTGWFLVKHDINNASLTDTVWSDQAIATSNEQIIPDWGLSVALVQVQDPKSGKATSSAVVEDDDIIGAGWALSYVDSTNQWLSGVPDQDGEDPLNWIRSGTYYPDNVKYPDYEWHSGTTGPKNGTDPHEIWEKLVNRTWAPLQRVGTSPNDDVNPNLISAAAHLAMSCSNLSSVDIVFTPDKSKWSRCVVVEMQATTQLAEGGQSKGKLRKHASWGLDMLTDGNCNPLYYPNGSFTGGDSVGMSWFPGYAIDMETGMRLNIFFGEDSWNVIDHGNDMIWNPTDQFFSPTFEYKLGGKHYVFVQNPLSTTGVLQPYDECQSILAGLNGNTSAVNQVWSNIGFVGCTMLSDGKTIGSICNGLIPTEAHLKFRVPKAYSAFTTDVNANLNMPHYSFSTDGIAAKTGDNEQAVTACDLINVVPNPYFGFSEYENSSLDNTVKFTNLPQKCTISIYSLDGNLIRKINYEDYTLTYETNNAVSFDWDLKNDAGVPISSGIYIIHISAEGICEKTIKWFGVMRPIDLDTF